MTNRNGMPFIAAVAIFAVACLLPAPLFGESVISADAKNAISSAFALSDRDKTVATLVAAASARTAPADRKAVLSALADFEERTGLPLQAAKHYGEASSADPTVRDYGLLLDSARACLAANDTDQAGGLVRAVLVACFDDRILLRARVYAVLVQFASGDRSGALPQLRTCAGNPVFADYLPTILFVLWWSDSDASAKARLLESYPSSPEASVARGDSSLAPGPFWFFMGRNEAEVAAFAKAGSVQFSGAAQSVGPASGSSETATASASAAVRPDTAAAASATAATSNAGANASASIPSDSAAPSGKVWQQIGFFRNMDYADELVGKLKKAGFAPVVRREKRASGTVYYSVVVPEDDSRSAGSRLKDAGFESCLVFD